MTAFLLIIAGWLLLLAARSEQRAGHEAMAALLGITAAVLNLAGCAVAILGVGP